ncbi:putative outer envelope pore protein [Helianthus anomalus]
MSFLGKLHLFILCATNILSSIPHKTMKASFKGSYDADNSDATGFVAFNVGALNLRASVTGETLTNTQSLNNLTLSVKNRGLFKIYYNLPKKDLKFQFMNNVRVKDEPLNFTHMHSVAENRTVLDSTFMLDSNHRVSVNYGFQPRDCNVKYSLGCGRETTVEPSYDFWDNSWDLCHTPIFLRITGGPGGEYRDVVDIVIVKQHN